MSSNPVTRKPVLRPMDPQKLPKAPPPSGKVIKLTPIPKDPPRPSR